MLLAEPSHTLPRKVWIDRDSGLHGPDHACHREQAASFVPAQSQRHVAVSQQTNLADGRDKVFWNSDSAQQAVASVNDPHGAYPVRAWALSTREPSHYCRLRCGNHAALDHGGVQPSFMRFQLYRHRRLCLATRLSPVRSEQRGYQRVSSRPLVASPSQSAPLSRPCAQRLIGRSSSPSRDAPRFGNRGERIAVGVQQSLNPHLQFVRKIIGSACPCSDTRRARTSLLCSSPRAMHAVSVARNLAPTSTTQLRSSGPFPCEGGA